MSGDRERTEPGPGGERPEASGTEPAFTDAELEAAVEELADRERFREAEAVVARAAPQLQRLLAEVLADAGWFGEAHATEIRKAATVPDEHERTTAVHTLLAEETRMGMMVGVAVGWALRERLPGAPPPSAPPRSAPPRD